MPKVADELERLNVNIESLITELRKLAAPGRSDVLAPPSDSRRSGE